MCEEMVTRVLSIVNDHDDDRHRVDHLFHIGLEYKNIINVDLSKYVI